MILTCPACGTQYMLKDGAIPPGGRQVRCAACKHSWHQDPDTLAGSETTASPEAAQPEPAAASAPPVPETAQADATADESVDAGGTPPADEAWADRPAETISEEESDRFAADEPATQVPAYDANDQEEADAVEAVPHESRYAGGEEDAAATAQTWTPPETDDEDFNFSPYAEQEPVQERGRPWLPILVALLLIGALAAAFWFLAPPEWKQRIGIAAAGETPLQLMMTHSDRQKLASGNELLAVSGRVINPTDESQQVPPIQAQLRSRTGQLVYSWTIAPPARTLPPRASATFNSAEVNVPAGGDELTITLGEPRA